MWLTTQWIFLDLIHFSRSALNHHGQLFSRLANIDHQGWKRHPTRRPPLTPTLYFNAWILIKDIFIDSWGKMIRCLHMWRVYKKRIPTLDKLRSEGIAGSTISVMCRIEEETIDHIFFECAYTRWILQNWLDITRNFVQLQQRQTFFWPHLR